MAKSTSPKRIESNSRKRKGVHSKKENSPSKNSKHYKKKYKGFF